ncbi:MAG: hypothetical protein IPP13_22305 [Kouleothrix sp.]|nr:hypothetical protein [Kouleothrix sp.]
MQRTSSRGRPAVHPYTHKGACEEVRLARQARAAREEFRTLPEKVQLETIARVRRILDEPSQRRVIPSPLARMARYVYGIEVPWIDPTYAISPEE